MFNESLKIIDTILEHGRKISKGFNKEWEIVDTIIYNYIKENNLIVSDIRLLNEEKNNSRSHVIYGNNIFKHANNLANDLAKINIYTIMKGNTKHIDYTIDIEGKQYVQLYSMLDNIFLNIPVIKTSELKLLPIEYEALSLFYKLYNPIYRSEWESIEKYIDLVNKDIKTKNVYKQSQVNKVNKVNKVKSRIIFTIIEWLKKRDDYILIGKYALKVINSDKSILDDNIQIIAPNISDELIKYMNKNKIIIEFKVYNVKLPIDPRIKRIAVSTSINGRSEHVMDIFDTSVHTLVPYVVIDNIKIGSKYILYLFLYIDIWIINIIHSLKPILNIYNEKIKKYYHLLSLCVQLKHSRRSLSYMGVNDDLNIYKKKNKSDYPYYPEKYRYDRGNYRII